MQRASAVVVAAIASCGCAASTELGVIQKVPLEHLGGSLGGHLGIGAVQGKTLVVDLDARADVGDVNSRVAFGASVLGGLPIGRFRVLARAGVWHAVTSSTSEQGAVPTFELAAYLPLRADPIEPASQRGWAASGIVVGVREDLDAAAYTSIFVGVQGFLIPGY